MNSLSGQIDFNEGVWRIDVPPHVSIRFKDIFKGISFGTRPPFLLKDSPDRAFDLQWFTSRYPVEFTPRAKMRLETSVQAYLDHRARVTEIQRTAYLPGQHTGFRPPEKADPHQARAADLFRATGRLLLLDDVGLGKTVSALAAIADGWGLPAAIVVQPHLAEQWQNKFVRRFTTLRPMLIDNRNAKLVEPHDVYIFKYSNIGAWVDMFEPMGIKTAIFDEIQELRHGRSTDKGRAARTLCDIAENRLGLTATPIYNYGEEIFNVVDLIAPGALGTYDEFVVNWCRSNGSHWVVKDPEALGAYLQSEGIALRRTENDTEVAQVLPPLKKVILEVGWNDGDVVSDRELQRQLALRVVNGSFTQRGQAARELDLMLRQETGIAKARSVAAYVRTLVEAGESVLLSGWHREVYRIWLAALADLKPVMFTGTEGPVQKAKAKAAILSGESKIMIISLRSGAGLDGLQDIVANVVIGELDWSPEVHKQLIGRARRRGQQRNVTVHCLHTEGGSDPVIMSMLGLKSAQAHGILNPFDEGVSESIEIDESRIVKLARQVLGMQAEDDGEDE